SASGPHRYRRSDARYHRKHADVQLCSGKLRQEISRSVALDSPPMEDAPRRRAFALRLATSDSPPWGFAQQIAPDELGPKIRNQHSPTANLEHPRAITLINNLASQRT